MPQLETSLRARFFLGDLEAQGMCGFPDDADKEECIRLLTAQIEDAEAHAESAGRDEMIDSAQENASLRLQLTDYQEEVCRLKAKIAELED